MKREVLTLRDVQLLQAIAQGVKVKDLPRVLGVSERIAHERVADVKDKLGVRSLARMASQYTLLLTQMQRLCQCGGRGACLPCKAHEQLGPAIRDMRRRQELIEDGV